MARRPGIKYPKDSVWTVKKNKWFKEDEEVRLVTDGYRRKKHGHKQYVEVVNLQGVTVKDFRAMYLKKRVK